LSWIEFNNVEVVYARQKVEPHQAGDPTHWKPAAFSQALDTQRTALYNSQQLHRDHHGQLEEHEEHLPRINLLSIGDGIYERVAARVAASPQDLVKTLKFVDSPSIAQLRQQLKLVSRLCCSGQMPAIGTQYLGATTLVSCCLLFSRYCLAPVDRTKLTRLCHRPRRCCRT